MAVNVKGGPMEFTAVLTDQQLNASLRKMEANINRATNAAVKDAGRMDTAFRNVGAGIAAYFSVQQLSQFVTQIALVRGEFQQLEVALETMLGSKEKADALFAEVVQLAATTPFELRDVGNATKQLLAYGFASDEIIETTRRLGDVSAGLGLQLGDLIYLYGTTAVQGRLYTRDLLQFTQRGIPLISELAKQFGVADSEIKSLVESGKVGFENVRIAIEAMTGEGGKFADLMAKQSKTITGQISNLQDAWAKMLNDIGEQNEDTIGSVINLANTAVENYEQILGILKVLIVTYGAYKAAVIATAAAQGASVLAGNIKAWFELARGIRTAKDAQIAFNLATKANPWGLVAGAIAGLITYLVVFREETESLTAAQRTLNDVQIDAAKSATEQEQKLRNLLAVAKNEKALLTERKKAIADINTISPAYLGNINLETISTNEATEATENYIKVLKEKALEEAAQAKRTELYKSLIEEQLTPAKPTLTDQFIGGALNLFSFNQDRGFAAAVVNRRMEQAKNERVNIIKSEISAIDDLIEKQFEESVSRESTEVVVKRTVSAIEEEIKALKEQQAAVSENRKQWDDFQNQINALEAEKAGITGDISKGAKKEAKAIDELRKGIKEFHQEIELAPLGKYARMLAEANIKFDEWIESAKKKAPELIKELEAMRDKYPQIIRDMILKDNDITSVGEISSPGSGLQGAVDRQLAASLKQSSKSAIDAESKRLKGYFTTLEAGTRDALKRTLRVLRKEMRRLEREGFSDQYLDNIREKAQEIENALGKQWNDDVAAAADAVGQISGEFSGMAGSLQDTHPELAAILETLGEIGQVAADAGKAVASFASGDIIGGITSAIKAVAGIFSIGAKRRAAERQAQEELIAFQTDQLTGEVQINQQYRERLRLQNEINQATLEGIRQAQVEFDRQKKQAQADFDKLMAELQGQQFISGTNYIHSTWFRKARTEKEFASLQGKSFEEIEELFAKGQLEGTAAQLFQTLASIRDEMQGIVDDGEEAQRVSKEILTGTTTDSIADGIIEGFRQGNLAAADFADNFQDLMQNAIIRSVRDKLLGDRLDKFYEQFAESSESGGALSESEITALQSAYNSLVTAAADQFKNLQDIAGIAFGGTGAQQQGLTGAIRREMTEETAGELAGLWRGQYDIVKRQLAADLSAVSHLNAIELNTANTVGELRKAVTELQAIKTNTRAANTRDLGI